jgi:hypothetical protein
MKFRILLLCSVFLSSHLFGDIITLTTSATTTTATSNSTTHQTNSTQIVIPANVTARILYLHETTNAFGTASGVIAGFGGVTIQVGGVSFSYTESSFMNASDGNRPYITGPATINLIAYAQCSTGNLSPGGYYWTAQDNMICTIETNQSPQFTPNTGVVIPADSNGPVNIILESSVDLINWIPADPGTYGTTTTNRFFRVRATR